jgi:inosose dehydratase
MTIRIGINPLTWTNDDMPELGAETSLETCLAEAKQAGYEGVELGNKFPRQVDKLKPIMQKHGLDIVSGWYGSRLLERSAKDEIKAVQDHLTLLKGMGCKIMVFAEVAGAVHGDKSKSLSSRPVMTSDQWETWSSRLNDVADYLADQGVTIAYHYHMGTVVQTAQDIDRLMASTNDNVGLLLDTGHLTFAGGDPMLVANRYAERINHVHCKDIRKDVLAKALINDWPFLKAVLEGVFTVPGDGMITYKPIVKHLRAMGYKGWLVVEAEQDPAKAHPLTYARKGYDYLKAAA